MNIRDLLIKHEGVRLKVYDDANGTPLKPGYLLVGVPTIGTGRNLMSNGITSAENANMLDYDIKRVTDELTRSLPWFLALDMVRRDVLVNMAYNMGLTNMLQFKNMLFGVAQGNYEAAARGMESSLWAKQVPTRVAELCAMMRLGHYL